MRKYDLPYYDKLEQMTADDMRHEWTEITPQEAEYLLEVLPPKRHNCPAFMVGECLTISAEAGPLYSAVCELDGHYYERPAPLKSFDPTAYTVELIAMFTGKE